MTARVAVRSSAAHHTAPLWPWKVPIQSPVVPERIIAVLSWQAEMRKTPSSVTSLNSMPATGLECPGQMSGACCAGIAAAAAEGGAGAAILAARDTHAKGCLASVR